MCYNTYSNDQLLRLFGCSLELELVMKLKYENLHTKPDEIAMLAGVDLRQIGQQLQKNTGRGVTQKLTVEATMGRSNCPIHIQ